MYGSGGAGWGVYSFLVHQEPASLTPFVATKLALRALASSNVLNPPPPAVDLTAWLTRSHPGRCPRSPRRSLLVRAESPLADIPAVRQPVRSALLRRWRRGNLALFPVPQRLGLQLLWRDDRSGCRHYGIPPCETQFYHRGSGLTFPMRPRNGQPGGI